MARSRLLGLLHSLWQLCHAVLHADPSLVLSVCCSPLCVMQGLMQRCMAYDPAQRPSFDAILQELKGILISLQGW